MTIGKFQRIRSLMAVAQISFKFSPAPRAPILGIKQNMMSMTYTKQLFCISVLKATSTLARKDKSTESEPVPCHTVTNHFETQASS